MGECVYHCTGKTYGEKTVPPCCLHYTGDGIFVDPDDLPIYRCPRCKRLNGWCSGAADDTPEICDRCRSEIEKMGPRSKALAMRRWRKDD